jgi:hypothetical protein
MSYLVLSYHYARCLWERYYLAICSAANAPEQMQDRPHIGRLYSNLGIAGLVLVILAGN